MIPPRQSAAFVWRMEAVLDLYEEPYDEKRPVVCFDERPCQMLADVRASLFRPVREGPEAAPGWWTTSTAEAARPTRMCASSL